MAALVMMPNGSSGVATIVATWQSVRRRSHMGGVALSKSGASVKAMTSSWPNLSDLLTETATRRSGWSARRLASGR